LRSFAHSIKKEKKRHLDREIINIIKRRRGKGYKDKERARKRYSQ